MTTRRAFGALASEPHCSRSTRRPPPRRGRLDSADVVIVGAGIVGASIAWHLARAGCRDVLLLEREPHQGRGSTGKSMGGVRAQFATDVNIRLSLYSIPFYARFDGETGYPCGYRPHGYLFVATTDAQMSYLRANHTRQRRLGLDLAQVLSRDEVHAMLPQLRVDDVRGGSYCPTDGFVDPYSVMNGFTLSALEHGVRLRKRTNAMAIEVAGGGLPGSKPRRARSWPATSCWPPVRGPRRSRAPRESTCR